MPAAGSTDGRPWDVVVLGGSGFYGQRVAAELLCLSAEAGQPLRIALVARSPGKLEAACKQVLSLAVSAAGEAPEAAGRMPQLGVAACDASDLASVRRLAASTRVLLACLPTYR